MGVAVDSDLGHESVAGIGTATLVAMMDGVEIFEKSHF
jgi:hypothetical protein